MCYFCCTFHLADKRSKDQLEECEHMNTENSTTSEIIKTPILFSERENKKFFPFVHPRCVAKFHFFTFRKQNLQKRSNYLISEVSKLC